MIGATTLERLGATSPGAAYTHEFYSGPHLHRFVQHVSLETNLVILHGPVPTRRPGERSCLALVGGRVLWVYHRV